VFGRLRAKKNFGGIAQKRDFCAVKSFKNAISERFGKKTFPQLLRWVLTKS
jgi:hypothetical protein